MYSFDKNGGLCKFLEFVFPAKKRTVHVFDRHLWIARTLLVAKYGDPRSGRGVRYTTRVRATGTDNRGGKQTTEMLSLKLRGFVLSLNGCRTKIVYVNWTKPNLTTCFCFVGKTLPFHSSLPSYTKNDEPFYVYVYIDFQGRETTAEDGARTGCTWAIFAATPGPINKKWWMCVCVCVCAFLFVKRKIKT